MHFWQHESGNISLLNPNAKTGNILRQGVIRALNIFKDRIDKKPNICILLCLFYVFGALPVHMLYCGNSDYLIDIPLLF